MRTFAPRFEDASSFLFALVVELVDTLDLGSSAVMRVGSSPIWRTKGASGLLFFVRFSTQTYVGSFSAFSLKASLRAERESFGVQKELQGSFFCTPKDSPYKTRVLYVQIT